jgi:hypothetical protein
VVAAVDPVVVVPGGAGAVVVAAVVVGAVVVAAVVVGAVVVPGDVVVVVRVVVVSVVVAVLGSVAVGVKQSPGPKPAAAQPGLAQGCACVQGPTAT